MHSARHFLLPATVVALTLGACGSDRPPVASDPVRDAAPDPVDAAAPHDASDAAPVLQFDASGDDCANYDFCLKSDAGTVRVHYRVHLRGIPKVGAKFIPHVRLDGTGLTFFSFAVPARDYLDGLVIFRPGDYRLGLGIDNNGDDDDDDPGDDYGWFDGTVAAPIQSEAAAKVIPVASGAAIDVEFGIGPR